MDIAREICTDSFYTVNSGLPYIAVTAVQHSMTMSAKQKSNLFLQNAFNLFREAAMLVGIRYFITRLDRIFWQKFCRWIFNAPNSAYSSSLM